MVSSLQQSAEFLDDDCERLGDIWALRVLLIERIDIECNKFHIPEIYALAGVDGGDAPRNNVEWRNRIASRLEALEAQPAHRNTVLFTNIAMLANLIELTPAENEILAFLILSRTHLALQSVVNTLSRGVSETRTVRLLGGVLKINTAEIRNALARHSALVKSGLIMISPRITDFRDKIGMVYGLVNAMLNNNQSAEELTSFYMQKAPVGNLSRADYPHMTQDLSLLLNYLQAVRAQRRKGVNILLYGKPGSGKTQFALLLSKELGMTLYSVGSANVEHDAALSPVERSSTYLFLQRLARGQQNTLVLFDEIEDILGSGPMFGSDDSNTTGQKAWINRLLEENPVPSIWIGNHVKHIDSAILRRFDYVLELRPPPRQTRLRLFQRYLNSGAMKEKAIRNLAEEEDLTPAVIERAGKVLECLPDRNAQTLCRIVSNQLRAQGRTPRPRYPTPADYRLAFVNTDTDIQWLETALASRPSAGILLHGAPGTGKTAYAHYLADALGQPLQFRRASDLLSMWVGGTEGNIAKMFLKAREDDAMILLDEADSLLQNREYAHHGWEVTQVNELLTQMEAFSGIFVCATNFLKHLDRAALRRFSLKIGFGYLTTEQSFELLKVTISQTGGREPDDERLPPIRERLSRIGNLTPGDFTVVRQQAEMLGRARSADEFLDSLERECTLKLDGARRPIGFVA